MGDMIDRSSSYTTTTKTRSHSRYFARELPKDKLSQNSYLHKLPPVKREQGKLGQCGHSKQPKDSPGCPDTHSRSGKEQHGDDTGHDATKGVTEEEAAPPQIVFDRSTKKEEQEEVAAEMVPIHMTETGREGLPPHPAGVKEVKTPSDEGVPKNLVG
mmetsp:Transcript_18723/g.26900  ORF Transcript_18723/g.26900 Transcript_18723/m.26900 type:complete len:157 (-) Transcript_18723:148-618(-)